MFSQKSVNNKIILITVLKLYIGSILLQEILIIHTIFFSMSIAETIKKLRKMNKMTQAELAEQLGTLQKVISDYENGRAKPPRDRLPKIAAAFGITVDELLGNKDLQSNVKSINSNSRAAKMLEAFEKLSPSEQRLILKQTLAIAEGKNKREDTLTEHLYMDDTK